MDLDSERRTLAPKFGVLDSRLSPLDSRDWSQLVDPRFAIRALGPRRACSKLTRDGLLRLTRDHLSYRTVTDGMFR